MCSTCNKVVQPSRGYRCPQCQTFLHPDPLKRKEAELANALRAWLIQELPHLDTSGEFRFTPTPEDPASHNSHISMDSLHQDTLHLYRDILRNQAYHERFGSTGYKPPPPDVLAKMTLDQLVDEVTRIRNHLPRIYPPIHSPKISVIDLNITVFDSLFAPWLEGMYSRDDRQNHFHTLGVTFGTKQIAIGDRKARPVICFFNEAYHFTNLRTEYYLGTAGALFLYNCTQKTSFERIPQVIGEFDQIVGNKIPRVLLGYELKTDVLWYPKPLDVQNLADQYRMPHYEVYLKNTDKTHAVLDEIFQDLTLAFLQQFNR